MGQCDYPKGTFFCHQSFCQIDAKTILFSYRAVPNPTALEDVLAGVSLRRSMFNRCSKNDLSLRASLPTDICRRRCEGSCGTKQDDRARGYV